MPAGYVKLLGVERYMWFYKSVPQAHLGGRTPIVPQGRVLGGGSSVNAMVYIRGQAGRLRPLGGGRPATPTGATTALLPYFTGMEDNERLNDRFHGIGGPWKVSDEHHICELTRAFLLAAQGDRAAVQPRLQRREPARRRHLADHRPRRPALLGRRPPSCARR